MFERSWPWLTVPALLDRRPRLAVRFSLLDSLALVVRFLSLCQAQGHFHVPVAEVSIRVGTRVMPFSTVLPISLRISWRCSSSFRRRVGS